MRVTGGLGDKNEKKYLDETHQRQRPVISPLFFFLLFASETLVVDQKHTNTLSCKVGTVLAICILIFKSPTLEGMVVFLKNISYQIDKKIL